MANYDQKMKIASVRMGQASDAAHRALTEILALGPADAEGLREQVEIIRFALREIREGRDLLITWAEIAVATEKLQTAQKSQ